MATNGTTREYAELRLPIGKGANGKMAFVPIGKLLVTDWGKDKPPSFDVEICLSHLHAVLYQQVLKATGMVTVVCEKADYSKRYKTDAGVPESAETEAPPDTSADVGHSEG